MSNFNYQEYLRNNPLLKPEVKDSLITESKTINEGIPQESEIADYVAAMYDSSVEEREGFQSDIWTKEEFASTSYDEASVFMDLANHLKSVGDKDVLEGNPDIHLELLSNGDIKWSADVTFTESQSVGETLNEGVFDKIKEKILKVADKIKNKFSEDEIAKMKTAVNNALGKDKLELSDITLDNVKKVANVMKDQLAEGQLEESIGDKIKKLVAGTGMVGGLAAAIVGGSLGTLSAPLVIGGIIAMIIGGMVSQGLDEEITEEEVPSSKMKVSELKAKIKEQILAELSLSEADEEEVDVDVDVEDEVEVEAGADDIEIERPGVKTTVDVGLSPEEEVVQDSLKAAMDAANSLGNQKLVDQIGNTITFFTREFVVGQKTD